MVSLTRDESTGSYAIIRHNVRTYESAGVMRVVTGKQNAEAAVKQFEDGQNFEDRHAGWRYFPERTGIKSGTDPALATQLRQKELEVRESKALLETDTTPSN